MINDFKLTKPLAIKVLKIVDAGLCPGLGQPVPGQMCVEAAVCFAMGLEHSDQPTCVSPVLRSLKITLNDKQWSSNQSRAKGLRRLAILQLGTAGKLNEMDFINRLIKLISIKTVPAALVIASKLAVTIEHKQALQKAAIKCKKEGTKESLIAAANAAYAAAYNAADAAANAANAAANAANAAAYAADDAANAAANAAADAAYNAADAAAYDAADAKDQVLAEFAEDIVHILIDMKVPAVKYLGLTE